MTFSSLWATTSTFHGAIYLRKTATGYCSRDDQPQVPVYAGFTPAETRQARKRKLEPSYMGTFTSAKRHVLTTFANTHSALMKKRVAQYMLSTECDVCHGKRLRPESLSVKFAGHDIAEIGTLPLKRLSALLAPFADDGVERAQLCES